jgi:hypothetical protein
LNSSDVCVFFKAGKTNRLLDARAPGLDMTAIEQDVSVDGLVVQ